MEGGYDFPWQWFMVLTCFHAATYLPTLIDKQLRPEVLRHDDPRFDDTLRYMA